MRDVIAYADKNFVVRITIFFSHIFGKTTTIYKKHCHKCDKNYYNKIHFHYYCHFYVNISLTLTSYTIKYIYSNLLYSIFLHVQYCNS